MRASSRPWKPLIVIGRHAHADQYKWVLASISSSWFSLSPPVLPVCLPSLACSFCFSFLLLLVFLLARLLTTWINTSGASLLAVSCCSCSCFSCCFLFRATDLVVSKPGKVELVITPKDGSAPSRLTVYDFDQTGGVALGMYNTVLLSLSFSFCSGCLFACFLVDSFVPVFPSLLSRCLVFVSSFDFLLPGCVY